MSYADYSLKNVRLIILRALSEESDYTHNETILDEILKTFGHTKSRDYIRNQLRYLEEDAGAITLREAGTVLIATITQRGLDHVSLKIEIEGIQKPSPSA